MCLRVCVCILTCRLLAALQIAVHDSDDEKHHSEGEGIASCFSFQQLSSSVSVAMIEFLAFLTFYML